MAEKDKELEALGGAPLARVPLTETVLASLEKLLSGTCPAPWKAEKRDYYTTYHCYVVDANDFTVVSDEAGDGADTGAIAALRNAAPSLISEIRSSRAWRKEAEAAIRWALGEAPLPDGRWFDAAAFGLHDRVPPFWWRRFLRLHSGLGEREGNAP